METLEDYYDDALKKATQEFTSAKNPLYGHTKVVQPAKPVSNVQARAVAINKTQPTTFGVGERFPKQPQASESTFVNSTTRRPSITTQAVQNLFQNTPTSSSTKPASQQPQYSQNVKDTAKQVVHESTVPKTILQYQKITKLTEDNIDKIVDSIGLISLKLTNKTKTEAKQIIADPKFRALNKDYLVNLAGHPVTQYFILQIEKMFLEQEKLINKTYQGDAKRYLRDAYNTAALSDASHKIALVILNGFHSIPNNNVLDNNTFSGQAIIEPIKDLRKTIPSVTLSDINEIEVPINFKETCPQKGGTRRRYGGSRRTKRRFN